ncbi:hypothetical protein P3S67_012388 [Capsicum chacoense]|uniref:uncharacterized protein LOC124897570 n=1 Tax=Capsicum annuum TaxID=4072 RepID=UPI001FB13402|nr:uncharacterized protein LOC124897570 [Capsicum annuum]
MLLSQFLNAPRSSHMHAALHVLWYLSHAPDKVKLARVITCLWIIVPTIPLNQDLTSSGFTDLTLDQLIPVGTSKMGFHQLDNGWICLASVVSDLGKNNYAPLFQCTNDMCPLRIRWNVN